LVTKARRVASPRVATIEEIALLQLKKIIVFSCSRRARENDVI